jgi:two-component system, chemotaxis family, CheB/CheR fusion protein
MARKGSQSEVEGQAETGGDGTGPAQEVIDHQFERLLDYIKRSRGFDFTGYKRASLERRLRKRMQSTGLDSFDAYIDHLEVHPQEFTHLFNTVLINVTGFFRDPAAWEYVGQEIVPRILSHKSDQDVMRVWCAGVASGEEAYSVAMVLAQAMGEEAYQQRVKIYATDVDDEALTFARQGTYGERDVADVPSELLARFFEQVGPEYIFRKDLRRAVIFGRHDLLQDAPISRIDLLVCRNALMYFNTEAQGRVLNRFHFALNNDGFLFLGRAEMLYTHVAIFMPVDLKCRIFAKAPRPHGGGRLLSIATNGVTEEPPSQPAHYVRFRDAAMDSGPIAQLAVDVNGFLVLANERARMLLSLTTRDLGRPLHDLEFSYRLPGLRQAIEQTYAERHTVHIQDLQWSTVTGDVRYLDIQAVPLQDLAGGAVLGVGLGVLDVTANHKLHEDLEHTNQELETAYEELQSTNEELETTNEELQSTVEELETTNEELQSTNEELETMNEELQSTNEELQSINDELRRRTEELNQSNAFLESILVSLRSGVIVLDRDLRVVIWNLQAENQWGLRSNEVLNEHFMNLDIGLPVEQLRQVLRCSLAGECPFQELQLQATNRRGKLNTYKVVCTPLHNKRRAIAGLILIVDENEE